MEETNKISLEKALAKMEDDVTSSIKSALALNATLKKLLAAAKQGKLKDLNASLEQSEKAEAILRQQISTIKGRWDFNEQEYLASGAFTKELLSIAQEKGLTIYERDDRIYCYPVFIRVLPNDRAVLINKVSDKKIRPSILINHLKELQKRPSRFNPNAFIEALYIAYQKVVHLKLKGPLESGRVVPLMDIYELFTLLPGQSKEYSKHEFARDIYLLHSSGVTSTKTGSRVSFPASTGTKSTGKLLSIIDEHGAEKRYYGISFSAE
ncbi:MAG: hypothetical protein ABH826_03610 [Patescibacteria group bacterium]